MKIRNELMKPYFFDSKKSELSKFIGKILQDILPEEKELALLIILVFSLIGTEVFFSFIYLRFNQSLCC